METQTQNLAIGSRLEIVEDYPNPILHYRQIGSTEPLCGGHLARPWSRALAFVVSTQLLQIGANMHRMKAKTDCFACMLALYKSIHYADTSTAGARVSYAGA